MLRGGHFDAYELEFAPAPDAAARWFAEHLLI